MWEHIVCCEDIIPFIQASTLPTLGYLHGIEKTPSSDAGCLEVDGVAISPA